MSKKILFRNFIIIGLVTVFLPLCSFGQLKLYPLLSSPDRQTNQKSIPSKNRFRIETSPDSVEPFIEIYIEKGHNPRCKATTNKTISFAAKYINGGNSPTFIWKKNGLILSNQDSFEDIIFDKDNVQCTMISNLDCAINKTITSNVITMVDVDTLKPTVTINSLNNGKDGCTAKYPLTFTAIAINGGDNPTFEWFFNNNLVTTATGKVFAIDSMANNTTIKCKMLSSSVCKYVDTAVVSNVLTRRILSNIIASTDFQLDSVTNPGCGQKIYNFSAIAINGGNTPKFQWAINNVPITNYESGSFSTPLQENGDFVTMNMFPSIACANPKISIAPTKFVRADTIKLPFFDDFSTSGAQPLVSKWIKFGGTYINNNYGFDPPSFNYATFDALQYNGLVYDSVVNTSRGATDNLTSLPIDLSLYQNTDSLYLSFFVQPRGLKDQPEFSPGDNLSLYFKDGQGIWNLLWQQFGSDSTKFKAVNIPVLSTSSGKNFFHPGFQFKFESTGRRSGSFDIWNLDYIFLNKNRTKSDTFFRDQSFSRAATPIFKNYSAIPYSQFKGFEAKELNETILTTINNLSDTFNIISKNGLISLKEPLNTYTILEKENFEIDAFEKQYPVVGSLDPSIFNGFDEKKYAITSSFVLSNDQDFSDRKGIPYTINNTISGTSYVDNYFAYDDGSAEYGVGIKQKFGIVAYRFVLNKPDTLKGIAMYFTRLSRVLSNQSFSLFISKKRPASFEFYSSTPPPNILYIKNEEMKYGNPINTFKSYDVNPGLALSDTFYIGYRQITDDVVTLGWDANSDSRSNLYYNISNKWEAYDDPKGSLMMRPVFGKYDPITQFDEVESKHLPLSLYPNPSSGKVFIRPKIGKFQIYDLQGKVLTEGQTSDGEIDLSHIENGMYVLKFMYLEKQAFAKFSILK